MPDYAFAEWGTRENATLKAGHFTDVSSVAVGTCYRRSDTFYGSALPDSFPALASEFAIVIGSDPYSSRAPFTFWVFDPISIIKEEAHAEGSPEPTEEVVDRVRAIAEAAGPVGVNHSLTYSHKGDGGILLEFRRGDRFADVDVFNDGDAVLSSGGLHNAPRVADVKTMTSRQIARLLREHLDQRP